MNHVFCQGEHLVDDDRQRRGCAQCAKHVVEGFAVRQGLDADRRQREQLPAAQHSVVKSRRVFHLGGVHQHGINQDLVARNGNDDGQAAELVHHQAQTWLGALNEGQLDIFVFHNVQLGERRVKCVDRPIGVLSHESLQFDPVTQVGLAQHFFDISQYFRVFGKHVQLSFHVPGGRQPSAHLAHVVG